MKLQLMETGHCTYDFVKKTVNLWRQDKSIKWGEI